MFYRLEIFAEAKIYILNHQTDKKTNDNNGIKLKQFKKNYLLQFSNLQFSRIYLYI